MPPLTKRQQEILKAVIQMLAKPAPKITTNLLAKELGISESALYRHFASKKQIYTTLITVVDTAIIGKIKTIANENDNYLSALHDMAQYYLVFATKNTGLSRLLVLTHLEQENIALVVSMQTVLDKFESNLRQVMRTMEMETNLRLIKKPTVVSGLIMSYLQGAVLRFIYSKFKQNPLADFEDYWSMVTETMFVNK